jgi:hypothetical protein
MLEGLERDWEGAVSVRGKSILVGLLLGATLAQKALADPWDGTIAPISLSPGDLSLTLGAEAGGAVFGASGHGTQNASGDFKFQPSLGRDFDTGLSLGLNATITASDPLSRGRYNGDVIEKAYGEARTGLGIAQIGNTDGAAYDLAVTGPKVDAAVSLDDPQTTFFRDPSTGRAFTAIFPLRAEVGASSNYAKFVYQSPALFGVQLALSFTPEQSRYGVPFLHEGPHLAGRQVDIWEGAVKYSDELGPVTVSAYGGAAVGRSEHKLAGQEGLSDLGAGLRLDYPVTEDLSLSAGGAYRQSNADAFQIARSYQAGTTRAMQASAAATYDSWVLGFEYGGGNADAVGGAPRLNLNGYQASLGYDFSSSISVSTGWQRMIYQRSSGAFYNGLPRIGLDAVFLHLNLKTSG